LSHWGNGLLPVVISNHMKYAGGMAQSVKKNKQKKNKQKKGEKKIVLNH